MGDGTGSSESMEATARREFEQTALPHLDNVYGVAMRLTRNPSEAEDLVQDTMVRAFRFWHSFKRGTNIKAWLFTIARNTFINGYHRKGRRRSMAQDVEAQLQSLGQGVALAHPGHEPPGPEEAVSARHTRARILEALESLPEDYRTAVTLADLEGLAYKEIAVVMDCPIGTVMSRIYRGRKLLYKLLFDHALETGLVDEEDKAPRKATSQNQAERKAAGGDPVSLDNFRNRRTKA